MPPEDDQNPGSPVRARDLISETRPTRAEVDAALDGTGTGILDVLRAEVRALQVDLMTAQTDSESYAAELAQVRAECKPEPIHAVCPQCGGTHVDRGEWATNAKLHRSHLCEHCGHVWRPFEHYTVGVEVTPLSAEIPEGQRLLREVNCELQLRELREVAETMHAVLGRYKSANRDAYVAWHKANDILKKVPR